MCAMHNINPLHHRAPIRRHKDSGSHPRYIETWRRMIDLHHNKHRHKQWTRFSFLLVNFYK